MSTLDAILHANMTVLTRDVYQRYVVPDRDADHDLRVGRWIVLGLLVVGYVLSVNTFSFLVTLVTLSGTGALQLLPGTLGVCFPTHRSFSGMGVLVGIGAFIGPWPSCPIRRVCTGPFGPWRPIS